MRGTENETFINEVVLRSQAQALYSPENIGHFGLNLRKYAHFTSPIRRYADLIVHRALITHARLGDNGLKADMPRKVLVELGERISAAERRAMAAERETVDRLVAHFLADQWARPSPGAHRGRDEGGPVREALRDRRGRVRARLHARRGLLWLRRGAHALVGSRSGETFRLATPSR